MSNDVTSISTPLSDWIAAAGAKQPTPGGGSVTAIVGALAAAMGEMTVNYSLGRKSNTADDEAVLRRVLAELTRARPMLLRLCEEDQIAYSGWQTTKKLDPADPARTDAIAASIAVPQAIMAASLVVLDLAVTAAPHANPWLLSDLMICGELATTAVRCGSYNVKANLADLPEHEADELRTSCAEQVKRAVERINELSQSMPP